MTGSQTRDGLRDGRASTPRLATGDTSGACSGDSLCALNHRGAASQRGCLNSFTPREAHNPAAIYTTMLVVAMQPVVLALCLRSPLPAARAPSLLSSRIGYAAMKGAPVDVDENWTTTASGLQFTDLVLGSGEAPSSGSVIKVDYTGWLEDSGKEFDSSIGRGPIAFAVGTGRVST